MQKYKGYDIFRAKPCTYSMEAKINCPLQYKLKKYAGREKRTYDCSFNAADRREHSVLPCTQFDFARKYNIF